MGSDCSGSEFFGIHNPGNWSAGKNGCCVVSDSPGGNVAGGDTFDAYYGGYLICESIGRSNIPIVAAAPKMLKALVAVRDAIAPWDVSLADEMAMIDRVITAATTPIAPVQSQPGTETAVQYEDIDQHDVFIVGDQYQAIDHFSERWLKVEMNIGCTRSQSSLRHVPCRRPVKQPTVESIAEQACDTEKEKPPAGIMPKKLWLESRRDDLYAAIARYQSSLCVVPIEWLEELLSLEREIQYEQCDIDCGCF